ERRHQAADLGSVLETVARAAAQEERALLRWMAVDQEVAVGRILVLADAKFAERPLRQRRKAPRREGAQQLHAGLADAPVAAVGIERRPVRVARDLEAPRFQIRKAVIEVPAVEVGPAGQGRALEARIALGRGDEGDLLAG